MAKLTYLQMVNRLLLRINQTELASGVSSATGHAKIISQFLNEAQDHIALESDWYSLITSRTPSTVADTATLAVASDHMRTLHLEDTTNNRVLVEDYQKALYYGDPDQDTTGTPIYFAIEGANYRFWPIPAGAYTLKDTYLATPTAMSSDGDNSSLPLEAQNALISYAAVLMFEHQNNIERADRERVTYQRALDRAIYLNDTRIDQTHAFGVTRRVNYLDDPRFPENYG